MAGDRYTGDRYTEEHVGTEILIESFDVSERQDVHKLKKHAVGLAGILFLGVTGSAPLTAMLGNVPFAVGFGNGTGAPAGFLFAAVILAIFSVGYVAMARKLTTAGGFYGFISHGLGRPLGMAAGWSAVAAYSVFEASLMGIFAFFARSTVQQFFHVTIPWPYFAFGGLILIAALAHFGVKFSARFLGVFLVAEVLVLLVMDAFVFAKGGASGISASPIDPLNAFRGLGLAAAAAAPGVGIFFAYWSWVGFEAIPNYGEESRDPKRIVPLSTYIAVIGLGVFYTLTSWAVISGWGLGAAPKAAASNPVDFFYVVAQRFVGVWARDAMEWLIVTGSFACGMAFHNAAARYFYSMGREGIFHRHLGRTQKNSQSPHVASFLQSGIATVLVILFLVFWYSNKSAQGFADFQNAPYVELYGWLAILGTFWILIIQTICSIATIAYFQRPDHRDTGHWWRTLVAPAIGAVGMGYAVFLLWKNIKALGGDIVFVRALPWIGVAWFLLGVALALWARSRSPEKYATIGRMINEGL